MPQRDTAGVRETCTVAGSTATLTGAVSPYMSFATAAFANGDTAWGTVAVVDANQNPSGAWVYCLLTWNTGGTVTLSNVQINNSGGTTVPTLAGTVHIFTSDAPPSEIVANTDEVLYRTSTGVAGAERLEIDAAGNPRIMDAAAVPATPVGGVTLFARVMAGFRIPAYIEPGGVQYQLQASLGGTRIAMITPQRTTGINVYGCGVQTAATISHPTIGTGSLAESIYRTRFSTSTTAGNASGVRSDQLALIGNANARGGFYFEGILCSGSISLAGGQKIFGLQGSNAALSVEPSALTNILAIGKDIGDASWQFLRNDGAGTAQKSPLVAIANNQTFRLRMFVAPSGTTVFVLVEQIANTGVPTVLLDTSFTTDIPAATALLAMHCQARNGATAAADNIEMGRMYLQSQF